MKWFMHQSQAHRDTKLKKVLIRYGAEGYGLYWYCIEHICADVDPKLTFELEHDTEILAHELKIDTLKVQEMLVYMVNLGLFEISDNVIYCLKLARYLGDKNTRNPDLKAIIQEQKGYDENGCPKGYVYFMEDESGLIKIGFSANPWARLKDIKSDRECDVELLCHVKGTQQHEKQVHAMFNAHRADGEWFVKSQAISAIIEGISSKKITTIEQVLAATELLRSSDVVQLSALEERRGEESKDNTSSSGDDNKQARIPYQRVVDLYHEKLPSLPRVVVLNSARKAAIRQRHSKFMNSDMEKWADYFDTVSGMDFLMGRLDGKDWRADFDFLVRERAMTGVFEGKYTNRAESSDIGGYL